MPYSQLAKGAIDDWVSKAGNIRVEIGKAKEVDEQCAIILQELYDECLDFTELNVDESVAFLLSALPRYVVYELGRRESKFLKKYGQYWSPTAAEWVVTLYRYCGFACNLFGIVLSGNCGVVGGLNSGLGDALVNTLPNVPFGKPLAAVQSAFGFLVTHPGIKNLARRHEDEMNRLTRKMSAEETGFAYRHFLFFRARPNSCKCGWAPLEKTCVCVLDVEMDPCKEYATALFQVVCARRQGLFDAMDRNIYEDYDGKNYNKWGKDEKLRFVISASQYLLSDGTFAEICKNIDVTMNPPKLEKCRKLTQQESHSNFVKSFAQHGGCQHTSCKAIAKKDCANVSCKKHCHMEGLLPCRQHKADGGSIPKVEQDCGITPEEILRSVGEMGMGVDAQSAAGNSRLGAVRFVT